MNFIRRAIIYCYGIPKKIITDNGTPFKNRGMEKLCQKFDIQYSFSTPYYPPAKGLAEAFKKMIVKILKKTVAGNKRDWDEKLIEVVIPIEVQVASLKMTVHQSITDDENAKIRPAELNLLDEKRLTT
ncbi:uncharacterized protein LOC131249618 [Magnolia sinica]|uniref:uncharacterized protein LOC131249618 n=1 Tax=Magnolia sinica TaxID=86752 RepID=UPI0026582CF3|nr:uncharacterized protein LOC131249618 [Magnolia sinica]